MIVDVLSYIHYNYFHLEEVDLARPDVQLVNREIGAGCRQVLDELLKKEGIPVEAVQGYNRIVTSHLAVARAVGARVADVGLALRAAAKVYGLDLVPISQASFDFVIPSTAMEHPAVAGFLEVSQSRALREQIGALIGYDVGLMGSVVAEIPAAA